MEGRWHRDEAGGPSGVACGIDAAFLGVAQFGFRAYAVPVGLSLSGLSVVYTVTSVARMFFITAATFAAMEAHLG